MMYHNKTVRMNMNANDLKIHRRVLAILCVFLLLGCVVLGTLTMRNNKYRSQAQQQFSQRMITAVANAVDEVNRMSGGVASNTTARLARVRQYIYHMDQLNEMSIYLAGGESGRLIAASAINTLYTDVDAFEALVQGSKSSTMDIRTQLLEDLTKLQKALIGN